MPPTRPTKEIVDRVNALKSERANWESWWQSLAKYCLPRKAEITTSKASGTQFDTDVYDSTAIESANLFASGLMGYLTNPSEPWLRLRPKEEALRSAREAQAFFDRASQEVLETFNGSNFYDQLHEFYLDYGIFGTAAFYSEEDVGDVVRYYSRAIREVFFDEDDRGRLKNVYRDFELTAAQAYDRWHERAGAEVVKAYAAKKYDDKFEFIQCVGPRAVYDPKKRDRLNKPVHSIWIGAKDQKRVEEGGFEEQPFNLARATKASGERHGYSPAMNVLPEIRMANKIAHILIRASMKATDPPLMLPHDNYLLPLNLNPGATNYKLQSTGAGSDEKIESLDFKGNIPVGRDMLSDTRETIKRGFFADLFLMLAQRDKTMTAYEVSELMGERMLILGPLLGRLQHELLEPVIVRTFNILARAGRLGEVPAALAQAPDYTVEYVSVLARAQQLAQLRGLQTFLLSAKELANIDPEVLDNIDADKSLQEIRQLSGVGVKLLRSEEEVRRRRAERRQAQETAMKLQMLQAGAEVAKTGGEAAKEIGAATGGAQT